MYAFKSHEAAVAVAIVNSVVLVVPMMWRVEVGDNVPIATLPFSCTLKSSTDVFLMLVFFWMAK